MLQLASVSGLISRSGSVGQWQVDLTRLLAVQTAKVTRTNNQSIIDRNRSGFGGQKPSIDSYC